MVDLNFNLDLIEKIAIRKKVHANVTWRDAKPMIKNWFGCIKQEAEDAGWFYFPHSIGGVWSKDKLFTSEELFEHSLIVNEENKWYYKSRVTVFLPNHVVEKYFNTDEEALAWVDTVVEKSNVNFLVLSN